MSEPRIVKSHDVQLDGQYELSRWEILFSKQDMRPVFIDNKESQHIYYDPIVVAPTVSPGQSMPTHQTFKQRVEGKGFLYVHEVQHWLREKFGSDDLKMSVKII